jgi:hypothetical protein
VSTYRTGTTWKRRLALITIGIVLGLILAAVTDCGGLS